MKRSVLFLALYLCLAVSPASASVGELAGAWRGNATLNGDATPALVEIEPCDDAMCAHLTMPELSYARLPMGPIAETRPGQFQAGNLQLTVAPSGLTGVLSGHGTIHLDAMPHGDVSAQISLSRSGRVRPEFIEEEITFTNGDVTLAGTLVRPRTRGPHPAIVAVLGSGDAVRWYSLGRAREWAGLGYAALVYDKRGTGASTGDWRLASPDDLAEDAIAGIRALQSRRDIQADHVGLWSHSQGSWVTPRALARGAPAAFLIAVGGGGDTPLNVEWFHYRGILDRLNVQGEERARAERLVQRYFDYLKGDIDLAALSTSLAETREATWYRPLGISRVIPTEEGRIYWRHVPTYDPSDDIAGIRVPVFVALAGSDEATPLNGAVTGWTRALGRSSARSEIEIYPGLDHHMRAGSNGWRRVSSAYRADLAAFLEAQRRDR
jgi:dienelactone hydrolase